jgi:hypothetical protein
MTQSGDVKNSCSEPPHDFTCAKNSNLPIHGKSNNYLSPNASLRSFREIQPASNNLLSHRTQPRGLWLRYNEYSPRC